MRYALVVILCLVFLTSCFKEDDPITPHDPGDVKTDVAEMTKYIEGEIPEYYLYQVYYDLGGSELIATNEKTDYDLGFECSPDGYHILLNTANFMEAANTGSDDFYALYDTAGLVWKFDKSDGNIDSTAIGDWRIVNIDDSTVSYTRDVYIINRGYDALGNELGLMKVQFESLEENIYTFRLSEMDNSNEVAYKVEKDPGINYIYFSFEGRIEILLEPPKTDWDVVFSQYTTTLLTNEGDEYPYLVTGALINRSSVQVAQDTTLDFLNMTRDDVLGLEFSDQLDQIGYDWKDVVGDVNTGNISYEIVPGLNYVIRDHEGYFYKLRFINFYNQAGIKGFPTFEYQRL